MITQAAVFRSVGAPLSIEAVTLDAAAPELLKLCRQLMAT